MSLVFPESHHLAEGARVCSQPGGWCQVVAHSYCSFCSQPGRWDRAASKLVFWRTCYVCGCECGWCSGGGESLESSPKEPAVPWLVVYRRAGAERDVGWEVRRSAPWKAPFLTAGDLPHICTSHTLLSSSSEGAGRTAVPSAHSADGDTEAHGVTGLRCCDDPVEQAGGTFSIWLFV